jgi:hypothetical protein
MGHISNYNKNPKNSRCNISVARNELVIMYASLEPEILQAHAVEPHVFLDIEYVYCMFVCITVLYLCI